MKKTFAATAGILVGIVIMGMFGCRSDSTSPSATTSAPSTIPANTVVMSASSFSPATLTVARGTTVTWRNDSGVTHTSTSDNTGWDTGDILPRSSRTETFNTAGTFAYHCTYHSAMGMVGTIIVQ